MKLLLLSIAVLSAFVAFWVLVVIPAERRHHERKLEMLRKRIKQRESARQEQNGPERDDEVRDSTEKNS